MMRKRNDQGEQVPVFNRVSRRLEIDHFGNLRFDCNQCGQATVGAPYSFAGNLACESCVRAFYRKSSEIDEELHCRRNEAEGFISRELKHYRKLNELRANHSCDVCGGQHQTENCPNDF